MLPIRPARAIQTPAGREAAWTVTDACFAYFSLQEVHDPAVAVQAMAAPARANVELGDRGQAKMSSEIVTVVRPATPGAKRMLQTREARRDAWLLLFVLGSNRIDIRFIHCRHASSPGRRFVTAEIARPSFRTWKGWISAELA